MAARLQVRHVRVRTAQGWQEPYDLDDPVVAIIGPADTGKSSLLDSIAFAMGRDIDGFRGIVDKHLREVEVAIRTRTGTWFAPVSLEAMRPGRMQDHGDAQEVSR